MAEQRLIDANALREDWLENGENEYVYDTNSFLESLDDAPTIDPEALPIVRQLRAELAREKRLCDDLQKDLAITANERDAALDRVKHHAGCWECKVREEGKCAMPFFKDECSDWEWRGPQKEE